MNKQKTDRQGTNGKGMEEMPGREGGWWWWGDG